MPARRSALALLMLGVLADDPHLPETPDNLALHAHFLY